MRLSIWHFDRYPTAPGVYLGVLPSRGHEVTWIDDGLGPLDEVAEWREGAVRKVEVRRRYDSPRPRPWGTLVNRWHKLLAFFYKASLMDRLARERPDVLQVRERITEGLLGLWHARRRGVRFAFQMDYPHYEARLLAEDRRGRVAPLRRLGAWWWIFWRGVVLRGADLVFAISDAQAEWLAAEHRVRRERIVPFPVGVSRAEDGEEIDPSVLGLAGSPLVVYMGNLTALRDPELLLRIFEAAVRRVPEARLLVIGEVGEAVARQVDRSPLRERITLSGFVPHARVRPLLRAGRVGIFPIPVADPYGVYRTSSPLKVLEYLAAGLPVVSSRIPEAERVLSESEAGRCVDNDPDEFAEAIAGYLADPQRAAADGARGRRYVAERRSFESLADRVEEAYRRLLAGETPSASATRPTAGVLHAETLAGGISSRPRKGG